MKIRILLILFLIFHVVTAFTQETDTVNIVPILEISESINPRSITIPTDSIPVDSITTDYKDLPTDSILTNDSIAHLPDSLMMDTIPIVYEDIIVTHPTSNAEFALSHFIFPDLPVYQKDTILLDSTYYIYNPLFNELIFTGIPAELKWDKWDVSTYLHYGEKPRSLKNPIDIIEVPHPETILRDIRQDVRNYITRTAPELYVKTIDQLPKFDWNKNYSLIETDPVEKLQIQLDGGHIPVTTIDRDIIRKKEHSPWDKKLHVLMQLSQIAISENWHLGGNNYMAILGVIKGNLNYNNGKKVQWENNLEWRAGFNSIDPETAPDSVKLMVNDDILKFNSKYGLKATGNFFYSTSLEVETQLFNNRVSATDTTLKAKLFTPVRFNIGIGMDYKYKDILSIALSPLAFQYTYVNDTIHVDPSLFDIEKGQNQLKEIGSKLIIELKSYRPIPSLKLDSKLNFYTNYKKIEVDWEITAELTFNRFFSTRLFLNPRYYSTALYKDEEKARIQMKEMLTLGFSYRFL